MDIIYLQPHTEVTNNRGNFHGAVVRSLALTWLMQTQSSTVAAGDPVPQLIEAARKEKPAGFLERVASRLVLGHLLAYNSPKAASAAADPAHNGKGASLEVGYVYNPYTSYACLCARASSRPQDGVQILGVPFGKDTDRL